MTALKLPGATSSCAVRGEFLGEQQSGMPMLQFADLDSDAELVETASRTADLMLKQYPEQAARHAARWFSAKAELLKA